MWNAQDCVVSRSSFGETVACQRVERMNIWKAGQVQITKGCNCWGETSWCRLYSKKLWRSAKTQGWGQPLSLSIIVKFWKSEFGMGWLGGRETNSVASAATPLFLEFFATDIWQKHTLLESLVTWLTRHPVLGSAEASSCSDPVNPLMWPWSSFYLVGSRSWELCSKDCHDPLQVPTLSNIVLINLTSASTLAVSLPRPGGRGCGGFIPRRSKGSAWGGNLGNGMEGTRGRNSWLGSQEYSDSKEDGRKNICVFSCRATHKYDLVQLVADGCTWRKMESSCLILELHVHDFDHER